MNREHFHLDGDWFTGGVPSNVRLGNGVYIDTSYSFDQFLPDGADAFVAGTGAGVYDRTILVAGPRGHVRIGEFCCLNGTTIIASEAVEIGDFALLSWSVVITDSFFGEASSVEERRSALLRALDDPDRPIPTTGHGIPVVIGDNVWIGFGAVVCPGVNVGEGAVIGARAVVRDDVAPYSVVVGDPARTIASLERVPIDSARAMARTGIDADKVSHARSGSGGGGTWFTGDLGHHVGSTSTDEKTTQ